jgi:hypothetical protein
MRRGSLLLKDMQELATAEYPQEGQAQQAQVQVRTATKVNNRRWSTTMDHGDFARLQHQRKVGALVFA